MAKWHCDDCQRFDKTCSACVTAAAEQELGESIKKLDLEGLRTAIEARAQRRLAQRLASLDQEIDKFIDRHFEKLIAAELGFKYNTWGEWELIQHSYEHHPLRDQVAAAVAKQAEPLILPHVDEVVAKNLSGKKNWSKVIREMYDEEMNRAIEGKVKQLIAEKAENNAEQLVAAIPFRRWSEKDPADPIEE